MHLVYHVSVFRSSLSYAGIPHPTSRNPISPCPVQVYSIVPYASHVECTVSHVCVSLMPSGETAGRAFIAGAGGASGGETDCAIEAGLVFRKPGLLLLPPLSPPPSPPPRPPARRQKNSTPWTPNPEGCQGMFSKKYALNVPGYALNVPGYTLNVPGYRNIARVCVVGYMLWMYRAIYPGMTNITRFGTRVCSRCTWVYSECTRLCSECARVSARV